jgi:hypothetical protein
MVRTNGSRFCETYIKSMHLDPLRCVFGRRSNRIASNDSFTSIIRTTS